MIKAEGITKRYGDTLAVNSLSFEVCPGRVTGFLGPNGAGKSTTMRLIMGLDFPDAGRITVNGKQFHNLPWPLREVGALLEARAMHPGRSAYNHLLALAQSNGIARSRVNEIIELVGLEQVARKRVGKFSLGMGQRLGIAAALLGDPGVLLFDEPVNGLDPEGIRWVRNLLRGFASEGRTVFVSSHLMSEMALTADQLIVVGRGQLIADAPMAEFIAQNSGQFVRVRTPRPDVLIKTLKGAGGDVRIEDEGSFAVTGLIAAEIGEIAARLGVTLHELSTQSASLEEAFMESTDESLEYRGDFIEQPAKVSQASLSETGVAGSAASPSTAGKEYQA
ncbi:MAG: ABC transporter ATP-binding protein [Acidimicrobiales bacterium]